MAFNPATRKQDTTKTKSVPVSQDLIYQAKQMFPGYDDSTAMALYVMNKAEKQQETDNVQNKLIQTQKSQNDKLTGAVKSLGQELHDFEQQSIETDREVERLKDLANKLRPAGELQKQTAKVSADALARLEQKLEAMKSVPGMDQEKFMQLAKQVDQIKSSEVVDNSEIQKIEKALTMLQGKNGASDEVFNKTMSALEKTQQSLIDKETRFQSYIDKQPGERQKVAKQVGQAASQEIEKFQQKLDALNQGVTDAETRLEKQKIDQHPAINNSIRMVNRLNPEYTQAVPGAMDKLHNTLGSLDGDYADATNQVISKVKNQSKNQQQNQQQNQPQGVVNEEEQQSTANIQRSGTNESIAMVYPHYIKFYPEDEVRYGKNNIVEAMKNTIWRGLLTYMENPNWGPQFVVKYMKELHHNMAIFFPELANADLETLKNKTPEPQQGELPLREGIGNIFENMINQIYKKL